jgi:hypothetical protein
VQLEGESPDRTSNAAPRPLAASGSAILNSKEFL